MKIIIADNFNRDYISERLLCDNVSTYWGTKIVEFLNKNYASTDSQDYFKLESDEYKLYEAQY